MYLTRTKFQNFVVQIRRKLWNNVKTIFEGTFYTKIIDFFELFFNGKKTDFFKKWHFQTWQNSWATTIRRNNFIFSLFFLLSSIFSDPKQLVVACYGQLPPDNYNRRPSRPQANEPPVQERVYLDEQYDYDQSNPINSNTNVDEDDDAIGRTETRPGKNTNIRQGPPLQGLLSFGDESADCKRKYRTLPHEKYCDVYFEQSGCEGQTEKSQAILRACPNGLVYTGNGRNGLIGVCDYPHRAECSGKERHSKSRTTNFNFFLNLSSL